MSLAATARALLLAALSPLLEKNVVKTLALDLPAVFSMSRVIVLAFAVATLRQLWHAPARGWPEATLAITVVLALPILGALERVDPAQVVALAQALVGRVGLGAVAPSTEPSKYDDHRADA